MELRGAIDVTAAMKADEPVPAHLTALALLLDVVLSHRKRRRAGAPCLRSYNSRVLEQARDIWIENLRLRRKIETEASRCTRLAAEIRRLHRQSETTR